MAVLDCQPPPKESPATMRHCDRKRLSCNILLAIALACGQLVAGAGAALAQSPNARQDVERKAGTRGDAKAPAQATAQAKPKAKRGLDRSGRKQVGKASYYARKFAGRKMADGTPMKPHGNNAASKTLPLGTTARVTNLETGQSATVVVRDRGPYVPGRIIDLSPSTAQEIGITREQGVARVEVDPIDVPLAKN
jgi:rare lipoprotein A